MQIRDCVARMAKDREERGRKGTFREGVRVSVNVGAGEDDEGTEEDENE